MKAQRSPSRLLLAGVGALALFAAACSDDDKSTATTPTEAAVTTTAGDTSTSAATTETVPATEPAPSFEGVLVGLFSIDPAVCTDGPVTAGSYFQMVQPGGTPESGPFIPNADSLCTADPTFSALTPGTEGGLLAGSWQQAPNPAFDAAGNGLAAAIFAPVKFFAVDFAGATDPNEAVPAILATNGVLTGDLSAFTAYYGAGTFNQGAPKPDGSGQAPTGTIDAATGAYTLEWTSLIVGGSFDGFTGVWHLEGIFTPAG